MRTRLSAVCAVFAVGAGTGAGAVAAAAGVARTAAASDAPALTVLPFAGGRHDRVTASITTRHATGVHGRTRSAYTLAATAAHPGSGCVNGRERAFPHRPAGTRARATLDPARGDGGPLGWCSGRYRATVTYSERYACPPRRRCRVPPGFAERTQTVARFSFRVR